MGHGLADTHDHTRAVAARRARVARVHAQHIEHVPTQEIWVECSTLVIAKIPKRKAAPAMYRWEHFIHNCGGCHI